MQVFTTIYLAETFEAIFEYLDENDQQSSSVIKFKKTLRERIATLEGSGFYETDDPDG